MIKTVLMIGGGVMFFAGIVLSGLASNESKTLYTYSKRDEKMDWAIRLMTWGAIVFFVGIAI